MEVFLRLNNDCERDYCIEVGKEDTLNDKIVKLFDPKEGVTKYMNFKPSIFHKSQPSGFYKSVHPGYLTINGTLIFDYDCDKPEYLEELDVKEKKIVDQVWPQQLILPKWEYNTFSIALYTLFMGVWLYTDLPDCISPTPGICLTNNISRILRLWAIKTERWEMVEKVSKEISVNGFRPLAQFAFFALHVLKILLITLTFKSGFANPITFNPFYYYFYIHSKTEAQMQLLKKNLTQSGWIGIRRLNFDEYYSVFHNEMIKRAGGQVQAYKLGYYKFLRNPGLKLSKNEGFQTPLSQRFDSNFKTSTLLRTEKKFYLSQEYYLTVEKALKQLFDEIEANTDNTIKVAKTDPSTQKTVYEIEEVEDLAKLNESTTYELLRNFRKFGFFELPKTSGDEFSLKEIYETLKQYEPEEKPADLSEKKQN